MSPGRTSAHQLWGGRFATGPAAALEELNRSLPVDYRLWPQDVRACTAWVRGLARASVLDGNEESQLVDGLARVAERLADGAGVSAPDEDVHTLVERLLYEEVGALAGKLATGRSRNDQVVTDLRLWTLDALRAIDGEVRALGRALVERARQGVELILPGYTHGQRAQPVRWAYVLLAHAWPLQRDVLRLESVAGAMHVLPLGAGAVAGSGIPIDREFLRAELGFERVSDNALDVTGERDFVLDTLFLASMIGLHVSRLAGELMTYASSEYGFVRLADAYCTGSSLMPQKRNPDVFELARAKAARTTADLIGLLSTVRSLPAGYSKDLQEDKGYLFDAVDTLLLTLPAVRGAILTLQPVPARMAASLESSLLATDLAELLVGDGVPFREAHAVVGQVVQRAEASACAITAVPTEALAAVHASLPRLVDRLGSWEESVERRATPGGSSREAVLAQIEQLDECFASAERSPV